MCVVSDATEKTNPGVEKVAGHEAAITLRVSTKVGYVHTELTSAET